MKKLITISILFIPILLVCQPYQFGSGIVYGPKAAFQICAPESWVLDNRSGRSQGLPCVLYLETASWPDSPAIMYAKVASPEYTELEDFVEFAYKQFTKSNPDFVREELQSLSLGNYEAKVYSYEDPLYKSFEATAYIQVKDAVCYIVFSTGSKEDYDKYLNSFLDAVKTFKYREEFINYQGGPIDQQKLDEMCGK